MVSPDAVAPIRMVGVSSAVNLPLHHKVQRFSSVTGSPGWSQKKGRKTVLTVGLGVSWLFVFFAILLCFWCARFSFFSTERRYWLGSEEHLGNDELIS